MQKEAARAKQDQNGSGGTELVASSFCVHFVFVVVAQWWSVCVCVCVSVCVCVCACVMFAVCAPESESTEVILPYTDGISTLGASIIYTQTYSTPHAAA